MNNKCIFGCKALDVSVCSCCGLNMCENHHHPWVLFTKRTNDPKLSWIESELKKSGIPYKRDGHSFHAPILKVREPFIWKAWNILEDVDQNE